MCGWFWQKKPDCGSDHSTAVAEQNFNLYVGIVGCKTRWLYKCNFRHKTCAYGIYLLNKVQCYWKKP